MALICLVLLLLGAAQADPPARWMGPSALSPLGAVQVGPLGQDQLRALAADIAEHLPADTRSAGHANNASLAAPLALHLPWQAVGDLATDELETVEWTVPRPGASRGPSVHAPAAAHGVSFDSTALRRSERPPPLLDSTRP